MLTIKDFFHLPLVDRYIEQIADVAPGISLVAGSQARPAPGSIDGRNLLSSGRATIFRVLLEHILAENPALRCYVITGSKEALRLDRGFRRQATNLLSPDPRLYAENIEIAVQRKPDLLVIDQLTAENAAPVFAAAVGGLSVFTQIDTIFRGAAVVRQMLGFGLSEAALESLNWIVTVQRLPKLCPHCKAPEQAIDEWLHMLRRRFPALDDLLFGDANLPWGQFYRACGCDRCAHTGRYEDIAVYDVFQAGAPMPELLDTGSILPLEVYAYHLAARGSLACQDIFYNDENLTRQVYSLLIANERLLGETSSAYERKLAELEAANRVLERRTRSVIALQDIGQLLISSANLGDLAQRVCNRACEICGADHAILYYRRPSDGETTEEAEVLAVAGWEPSLVHQRLPAAQVFLSGIGLSPRPFDHWPPGVPHSPDEDQAKALRSGLYVPLVAQGESVGLMIVHNTEKPAFAPGDIAMLQTFANQAALAIQRAGLVEQLRDKITLLESAQVQLLQKERIERELELARQVQQNVLPRTFPKASVYRFAAHNRPARWVGGDFYDVIELDQDRFAIAVADVSDKGMPAALYMALARSLLLAEARRGGSPVSVVTRVNQLLLELGEPDMFVTLFYGVLECSTQRLTYVRAGHDPPILLRADQARLLDGLGTALGVLDGEDFRLAQTQIDLSPGDRLVLYSDGLVDVLDERGFRFGRTALQTLLGSCADYAAQRMCQVVFDTLDTYRDKAEQYDDMTLLVVEVI